MKPIIFLLILALPAFARLGETKEACAQRYGNPIKSDGSIYGYRFNGFLITIVFAADKAGLLLFTHVDPKEEITDNEFRTILKANAGERTRLPILEDNWKSKEAASAVLYTNTKDHLLITDQASIEAIKKQSDSKEAELLKGF